MPDMTITTTVPQATRLTAAIGARLGLVDAQGAARSATAAEVKAFTVSYLRSIVQDHERLAAVAAQQAGATPFEPS